jgi:signal transduction histidine kinase
MIKDSGKPPNRRCGATLANEVRTEVKGSMIGIAGLSAVFAYLAIAFDAAAHPAVAILIGVMALVMAVWCGGIVRFIRTKPGDAEILRFWVPFARSVMRTCDLVIAVSPWVLLPLADETLRSFMIVLYVWFVMLQVLISTEATRVTTFATVSILGSLILYAQVHGLPHRQALSLFFLAFGATMLIAARFIRQAVLDATAARLEAEENARALAAALKTAAAERDAKVRFLASASHDLQQPIQAARLFFERAVATADLKVHERAVAGARLAFSSVESLIDGMLVHLRLGAAAAAFDPKRMNVGALIASVIEEHGPAADKARVALRAARTSLTVDADPDLLRRALGNLITNAIRHAGASRILVGARRGADGVRIWVVDDGRGVAVEEGPALFDDYSQGSRGSAAGGFGIGLSSAKRIMALHGGTAGLDRRWTGGAAFYLHFPDTAGAALPRTATGEVECEAA